MSIFVHLISLTLKCLWLLRIMGAAALQKYIGSLGGIGTPGVGSSSSYAPKELNKEVMPEKVNLFGSLTIMCLWLFNFV